MTTTRYDDEQCECGALISNGQTVPKHHLHNEPPRRAGAGEHTPLPWVAFNADDDGDTYIGDDKDHIVAEKLKEADAALVLRSVNIHTTLIAALEDAEDFLDSLTLGNIPPKDRYSETCRAGERVRAALQNARE
jgi:hypothetical protein